MILKRFFIYSGNTTPCRHLEENINADAKLFRPIRLTKNCDDYRHEMSSPESIEDYIGFHTRPRTSIVSKGSSNNSIRSGVVRTPNKNHSSPVSSRDILLSDQTTDTPVSRETLCGEQSTLETSTTSNSFYTPQSVRKCYTDSDDGQSFQTLDKHMWPTRTVAGPSGAQSQKSSVVGLNWLFNTDSDSGSSGNYLFYFSLSPCPWARKVGASWPLIYKYFSINLIC